MTDDRPVISGVSHVTIPDDHPVDVLRGRVTIEVALTKEALARLFIEKGVYVFGPIELSAVGDDPLRDLSAALHRWRDAYGRPRGNGDEFRNACLDLKFAVDRYVHGDEMPADLDKTR